MGVMRVGLLRDEGSANRERGTTADLGVLGKLASASLLASTSLAPAFAADAVGLQEAT